MQSLLQESGTVAMLVFQWLGVLLIAPAISVAYFLNSPHSQALGIRLLASSHGATIAIFYILAAVVFETKNSNPRYGTPFAMALVLPVLLMALSFAIYRGPKRIHFLQLLNAICLFWTFFVGTMAITGNWL